MATETARWGMNAPLETTFDALFRQLSGRLRHAPSEKPLGPDRVPVAEIRTAPALFAARSPGTSDNPGGDQGHARELERALRAKPSNAQEFDPLTVFEIAGEDFCIDGHHRLAVYRAFLGAAATVPVVRIGGTLGDAVAASVRANSRVFLQMNHAERQEAAWKLVKIGQGSKREQAALSGMGETFIAKLRRLRRDLGSTHPGRDWGSLWEAQRLAQGVDGSLDGDDWTDEMEAAKVAEYAQRLRRSLGRALHSQTVRVVAALETIIGPPALVEAVREVVSEVDLAEYAFTTGDDEFDSDF